MNQRLSLTRFAWLSIATAVATIAFKAIAYFLTGSIGLLADALESGVNLVAAVGTLVVLIIAAQPPDDEHAFGHDKAEYFSGGLEGGLIVVAAVTTAVNAAQRLLNPQPLEQAGLGLVVSLAATGLNLVVARILLRAGQEYRSMALEADAYHLMSDVWTSAGVIVGVALVVATGWQWLDPVLGLGVALFIVRSGLALVRRSVLGLMDTALPKDEIEQIEAILEKYAAQGVYFHALRTRQSGSRRFVSCHIQVPGTWTVEKGHSLLEEIERDLRVGLSPISVLTHLEPLEDPRSWQDIELVRE